MASNIEDHLVRLEIEDFLWSEADLLDEHQYDEWLDLFTEDAQYLMPIRRNVPSKEMDSEYIYKNTDMWWYRDDKRILEKRVKQLNTPRSLGGGAALAGDAHGVERAHPGVGEPGRGPGQVPLHVLPEPPRR